MNDISPIPEEHQVVVGSELVQEFGNESFMEFLKAWASKSSLPGAITSLIESGEAREAIPQILLSVAGNKTALHGILKGLMSEAGISAADTLTFHKVSDSKMIADRLYAAQNNLGSLIGLEASSETEQEEMKEQFRLEIGNAFTRCMKHDARTIQDHTPSQLNQESLQVGPGIPENSQLLSSDEFVTAIGNEIFREALLAASPDGSTCDGGLVTLINSGNLRPALSEALTKEKQFKQVLDSQLEIYGKTNSIPVYEETMPSGIQLLYPVSYLRTFGQAVYNAMNASELGFKRGDRENPENPFTEVINTAFSFCTPRDARCMQIVNGYRPPEGPGRQSGLGGGPS